MPDVPPDLAGKVLSADLRNIVKKVGDGTPLSSAERELMERHLAQEAIPEDLVKARRAALIRKWALGGKLSKEEREEIAAEVPSTQAAKLRTTRGEYQHTLMHYAKLIGYDSDRSMKRWIDEGRKQQPPDPPPFDELSQLAAWWRRVKPKRKVPAEILRFELDPSAQPSAKPPSDSGSAPAAPAIPSGTSMDRRQDVDLPPELVVQKLRDLFQARFEQWCRAVDTNAPDADRIETKMNEVAEKLRRWEKDLIAMKRERGDLIDQGKLNTELVSMWSVMAQSFFNALLQLAQKLSPEQHPGDRRALVIPIRDACFTHLKKTRFTMAYEAFEALALPPSA